ncbi:MAG: type V CRISPR-associated protein Cas12b [Puniceicoccales bacterium]|jgi:hypothetical protein|nr:type V CRISPR-associated protein Cas12b [Puniceicoccales bacterium]
MSLNRIYQGRVSKVEVDRNPQHEELPANSNGEKKSWTALDGWEEKLWKHHELFQDAVNYYTLALAAMARGASGSDDATAALCEWVDKVRETWVSVTKKSEVFDGPQKSVSRIFAPDDTLLSFEEAAEKILSTSRATMKQRVAAVSQLLAEKGALNQLCVSRLPWFASAKGKLSATSKAAAARQEQKRQQAVRAIHNQTDTDAIASAPKLDLGLFLTAPPTESISGKDAVSKLCDYFKKAAEAAKKHGHAFDEDLEKEFSAFAEKLPETFSVPAPGRKPSGLYPIAAAFKYFPRAETLAVFKAATKSLAETTDKEVAVDTIADARVDDQPQFDYFSNLAFAASASGDDGEEDENANRAVWFNFDLAAFVEAIKAPRRYFEDTQTRKKNVARIQRDINAMLGKGRVVSAKDTDDEASDLPGFEDDKRICLIKEIVEKHEKDGGLAWQEDESSGSPVEYAIDERTLRGYRDIREKWRKAARDGNVSEAALLKILAEEQTGHRDDFGSATFYQKLAKPKNHAIWRDGGTQSWHAEDPVQAWLNYCELRRELDDKNRPIRFTPAHPIHSPRYFIFPKKNESKEKKKGTRQKFGRDSQHVIGELAFAAGIAVSGANGKFDIQVAKITYSAPRLLRDNLRAGHSLAEKENLHAAHWIQPMMAVLDIKESATVNFANCSLTLQAHKNPESPDKVPDIQVTIPLPLSDDEVAKIHAVTAKGDLWMDKQFNQHPEGETFHRATLRWPHEKLPKDPPKPWHERVDKFQVVSVDLGQRDAGAFARLLVSNDLDAASMKKARFVGETDSRCWHAKLLRSGLFRLPGEDAKVWREQSPKDTDRKPLFDYREELWGERGRPARDWEADETARLMRELETVQKTAGGNEIFDLLPEHWRDELSFPEQNDKLLIALRRYQSKLARLHRWIWFLEADAPKAWTEMEALLKPTADNLPFNSDAVRFFDEEAKNFIARRDPRIKEKLLKQLNIRTDIVQAAAVAIANRVLPLRGRSWKWDAHPAATSENPIRLLSKSGPDLGTQEHPVWIRGQRGLSMERIEQIEELRKRFQSLNQLLRRAPGQPPRKRRDESIPDPCPDLLVKLGELKTQRVNQTAHFILAEALGLRLAKPAINKKTQLAQRDIHGSYEKIKWKNSADDTNEWIGCADFIVIEDLSRYRTSQGRAPSENSRLMKWCHRAVRDKLAQLCEVFGIPVVETPAAYSSRFCSRSGVPGFRAYEVTAGFTKTGQWAWLASKKEKDGNPTLEASHLQQIDRDLKSAQTTLENQWRDKEKQGVCPKRTLLVPKAGGPVFVPIVDATAADTLAPAVTQADVNAAINLGLRAVADPRLWEIQPRLRTQKSMDKNSLSTREKRKFGEKGKSLALSHETEEEKQPNYWADFANLKNLASQLATENPKDHGWLGDKWSTATIEGETNPPSLVSGKSFWGCVKAAQWKRVREINQKRLDNWQKRMDDLPM